MKMKKMVAKVLTGCMLAAFLTGIGRVIPAKAEFEMPDPILLYDFEGETDKTVATDKIGKNNATIAGRTKYMTDNNTGSTVLNLQGRNGYLEFPTGFFDNRDTMTLSLDVCSLMDSQNFFTVAIGKDNISYLFLRTRSGEIRYAITKDSYGAEDDVMTTGQFKSVWNNITLVIDQETMWLYVNGECVDEQKNLRTIISDFGSDVIGYIGKSFYSGDAYFNGYIDNVKVYDEALSATQIALAAGVEMTPFRSVEGVDSTLVTYDADKAAKTVHLYVSKSAGTPENGVAVRFTTQEYAKQTDGDSIFVPFDSETEISFLVNDGTGERTESWTVTASLCGNPVLAGQYADPDIDVFGDTYFLYTTTDGFAGWSGTVFHAFSSKNLVDWKDEGIILNVAKGGDVAWSTGSAWAPTIEEKNGRYYFYFCAKDAAGVSHIGVAVADTPVGPFTAMPEPLMTVEMCKSKGVSMGQAIDPSIFTEEDGTSYMLFGNGAAAVVKLNDDMVSCDLDTLKNYRGVNEFREAITVVKRDGMYHFTWSCDDTGSPDYHVNYGTSDSIYGPIDYQYAVLSKVPEQDILGTGHHSMLQIPGEDEYYIAYHRFYTPLGFFSDGTGHHRQTCIDKVTFGADGLMQVVTPTLEGPAERVLPEAAIPTPEPTPMPTATPMPTMAPQETVAPTPGSVQTMVTPTPTPDGAQQNQPVDDVAVAGVLTSTIIIGIVVVVVLAGGIAFVVLRKRK